MVSNQSREQCLSVLVIEDDRDVLEALTECLADEGCHVLAVSSVLAAFEVLESMETLPRLILLDLVIPHLNGWEFRQKQLEHPRWRHIPVVVISASDPKHVDRSLLESVEHLRKPFAVEALLEIVRKFIKV